MRTLIATRNVGPFAVATFALEEDLHPKDCFDYDEYDLIDTIDKINQGSHQWFRAEVVIKLGPIELGRAYIPGRCYETFEEFLTDDQYYHEYLIKEALDEARKTLDRLAEIAHTLAA